jgi:hypothetical protein
VLHIDAQKKAVRAAGVPNPDCAPLGMRRRLSIEIVAGRRLTEMPRMKATLPLRFVRTVLSADMPPHGSRQEWYRHCPRQPLRKCADSAAANDWRNWAQFGPVSLINFAD